MKQTRNERGIALAISIFALVLVGMLVAGAFFAGTQEQRVAESSRRLTQSFGITEEGLVEQVRLWDPMVHNRVATYAADSLTVARTKNAAATGSYGGHIYKLNSNLFLIDVNGADSVSRTNVIRGGGARQRLGLIARIRPVDFDIQASLTTQGSVKLQGTAEVDGNDQNPASWTTCDAPDTNRAGVRTTGTVDVGGSAVVDGDPPVFTDPTLTDSSFKVFGDVTFDELAARANITLPGGNYSTQPVVVNGVCDRTRLDNWGDGLNPTMPCGNYLPIIYINGTATLNGVQGQGILLVNGNLNVQGSYEWFGVVIVQGDLKTTGGGVSDAHFWGGVMARNADLSQQSIAGSAVLNYSKCAILKALQATGIVSPLRSRSWVQLF